MLHDQFQSWFPDAIQGIIQGLAAVTGFLGLLGVVLVRASTNQEPNEFKDYEAALAHEVGRIVALLLGLVITVVFIPFSLVLFWIDTQVPYEWLAPFSAVILSVANDWIQRGFETDLSFKEYYYPIAIVFLAPMGLPMVLVFATLALDITIEISTAEGREDKDSLAAMIHQWRDSATLAWGIVQVSLSILLLELSSQEEYLFLVVLLGYLVLLLVSVVARMGGPLKWIVRNVMLTERDWRRRVV